MYNDGYQSIKTLDSFRSFISFDITEYQFFVGTSFGCLLCVP